eukprot:TRINITY_DN21614_c0_g1_i1.p1 TRINITY_DN21614_c0_g1~~TRINITY_DN21614_c0_g1_i1.p1  ORF type:complete len:498 (-),score=95.96 TRINITY_DN21614_c0_g1_i1:131-1624(-)
MRRCGRSVRLVLAPAIAKDRVVSVQSAASLLHVPVPFRFTRTGGPNWDRTDIKYTEDASSMGFNQFKFERLETMYFNTCLRDPGSRLEVEIVRELIVYLSYFGLISACVRLAERTAERTQAIHGPSTSEAPREVPVPVTDILLKPADEDMPSVGAGADASAVTRADAGHPPHNIESRLVDITAITSRARTWLHSWLPPAGDHASTGAGDSDSHSQTELTPADIAAGIEAQTRQKAALVAAAHPLILYALHTLAHAYDLAGRGADCLRIHTQIVELTAAAFGEEDLRPFRAMGRLAVYLAKTGGADGIRAAEKIARRVHKRVQSAVDEVRTRNHKIELAEDVELQDVAPVFREGRDTRRPQDMWCLGFPVRYAERDALHLGALVAHTLVEQRRGFEARRYLRRVMADNEKGPVRPDDMMTPPDFIKEDEGVPALMFADGIAGMMCDARVMNHRIMQQQVHLTRAGWQLKASVVTVIVVAICFSQWWSQREKRRHCGTR